MLKKIGFFDLLSSIRTQIEAKTGLPCKIQDPTNITGPGYFAEVIEKVPAGNETMFRETFLVSIHCIPPEGGTVAAVYDLIQQLEEALEDDLLLPGECVIFQQESEGIQVMKAEETDKKMAIAGYSFTVRYGFKSKI